MLYICVYVCVSVCVYLCVSFDKQFQLVNTNLRLNMRTSHKYQ